MNYQLLCYGLTFLAFLRIIRKAIIPMSITPPMMMGVPLNGVGGWTALTGGVGFTVGVGDAIGATGEGVGVGVGVGIGARDGVGDGVGVTTGGTGGGNVPSMANCVK